MTKGWLPPPSTRLLVPAFCKTVLACAPFRPVKKGTLFGFTMLLRLLDVRSGVPPITGKKLSLALENGMPLISVLAMIPVTTLAVGWDPPRTSCMKKDNFGGVSGPACATVALAAATGVGKVGVGPGNGATSSTGAAASASSSTGGATTTGASASVGTSESSSGVAAGVVAENWPPGKVVAEGTTVVAAGLDDSGKSAMTGG